MPGLINFPLLKNPYNWLVVGLTAFIYAAAIHTVKSNTQS